MLQMLRNIGKRTWSGSGPSLPTHSSHPLSITCRGKPISREELFTYSNGRFLINEAHALNRRYIRFDIDQLCNIAAAIGPFSPIQSIEKMEGGFSKALLMRKEDGSEMVAKIPFPHTGPAKYTTASEVAVLKYLRTHTKCPVPKVFAWSSDASNPVGAEYIIMEKSPGVQLFWKLENMNDYERLELIQGITQLEGEIAAIQFPAHGSLYLRESLDEGEPHIMLSPDIDPSGEYCMGPSCEQEWYTPTEETEKSLVPQLNRGPWPNISSFGIALVEREVTRIKHRGSTITSMPDIPCDSTEEQLAVLEMTRKVMSMLDTGTLIDKFSKPTLWHTDLHMGNIFVSDEDPTKVVSIIDWQSISVSPLLLQADFAKLINVSEDFTLGSPLPQLPPDYATMDAKDKELAEFKVRQDTMAMAYEVSSALYNPKAYQALFMPSFLRDIFTRCAKVSEEGVIPLRESLIQFADTWDELDFKEECPFTFSEEEVQKHNNQLQKYRNFHGIQKLARKLLQTDGEGWISPYYDFTGISQQNKEILEELVRQSDDFDMSPEEIRRLWPFVDSKINKWGEASSINGSKEWIPITNP